MYLAGLLESLALSRPGMSERSEQLAEVMEPAEKSKPVNCMSLAILDCDLASYQSPLDLMLASFGS